jgi:hypothetical protein
LDHPVDVGGGGEGGEDPVSAVGSCSSAEMKPGRSVAAQ